MKWLVSRFADLPEKGCELKKLFFQSAYTKNIYSVISCNKNVNPWLIYFLISKKKPKRKKEKKWVSLGMMFKQTLVLQVCHSFCLLILVGKKRNMETYISEANHCLLSSHSSPPLELFPQSQVPYPVTKILLSFPQELKGTAGTCWTWWGCKRQLLHYSEAKYHDSLTNFSLPFKKYN